MMNRPQEILLSEFTYDLPEENIAKFPLTERDQSRLLIYRKGIISESKFSNLPELIDLQQRLVFNDTRVIHARLKFRKSSGGLIEIFCLEPLQPSEYQTSFASDHGVVWKCLVGNARKWKDGSALIQEIRHNGRDVCFKAEKRLQAGNAFHIQFSWTPVQYTFSEILGIFGETPIPPYLKREAVLSDSETYQTIYSQEEGSVAAPTAGLHFTKELLKKIDARGIERLNLTLHVGAGTFTPVKVGNAANHPMHIEKFQVTASVLKLLARDDKEILSTGTTTCRTLESLYWLGVKILCGSAGGDNLHLEQWEAWDLPQDIPREKALNALYERAAVKPDQLLKASTGIMITPGYRFRMISGLITNFHQPSSTLLMLIAAFIGDEWKAVYKYALEHNFRFLSYGDSSLLLP